MTQFGGSLRFVQLPAVVQLLSELASTGRLSASYADWTGEIVVRDGQIVAAHLGEERGRAALEAIAVALPDGEFSFVDEPVAETGDALVSADERVAYLDRLGAEHQRLSRLIPSLKLVPRLVEAPRGAAADTQVTLEASALQLIPALVLGHTLDQVARQRGLGRTMRDVAVLIQGGVVELAPASSVSVPEQVAAGERPSPVAVKPFSARLGDRRFGSLRQRSDAAPVAVASSPGRQINTAPRPINSAPRPINAALRVVASGPQPADSGPRAARMPPAVAERLSVVRPVVMQPAARPVAVPPRGRPPVAAWRKAIVGFFLQDEEQ